ncbi:hypothetical protein HY486_00065 [Candidatus Woesearchaeota archaeon]|nr:hypothetical protein [Candidatus Woesearchaeota archaeon]
MENESVSLAYDELKRADHLMFVSLKYTRTVDVIKSIIERLMNAVNYGFEVLLQDAKKKKRISDVPSLHKLRIESVRSLYPEYASYVDFYLLLRKIDKAEFERTLEYRRHVCMTAVVEGGRLHITIDIVQDYYEKAKEFIDVVASSNS